MTTMGDEMMALAAEVLEKATLYRCQWDLDEESEFVEGGCEADAVCEVEGPHEERCGFYCAEHAERTRLERCSPPHRYHVNNVPGAAGIGAARRLAAMVLNGGAK